VIDPADAQELQAPWLWTVRLLVQGSYTSSPGSRLPAVSGIPVVLTDATGVRSIRPLRPVGEPGEPGFFYEAEFLDVAPGVYKIELLSISEPGSAPSWDPLLSDPRLNVSDQDKRTEETAKPRAVAPGSQRHNAGSSNGFPLLESA
jgi:hypothetical protein